MNKVINIDIEEVLMNVKVIPITANIGSPLKFDMNITDQSGRKIKSGYISVSLNDIFFMNPDDNEEILYVNVQDGEVSFNADLPLGIQADTSYTLKILYQDNNDPKKYADTLHPEIINIGAIPTQIFINTIYGNPGLDQVVDYNIQSSQNEVNSGLLIAYYGDQEIGRTSILSSDGNITLHIPKIPTSEIATVYFKYIDDSNGFSNSDISVPLVLNKSDVNITTSISTYYPQQTFNFFAYCKDIKDQDLLTGELTLYIDNVKHSTRPIVNGEAIFSLKFNTIKEYQLLLVYEEDEYYNRTLKEQTFYVNNIPITNIKIDDNYLIAEPNSLHEIELKFETENNLEVNDGYVDIYFNNKLINTYTVVQGKKYISLQIPNLPSNQQYPLKIKYYNSKIFNDYIQQYECGLTYIPFEINVDPIVAQANDEIQIHSVFTNDVYLTGILEYYLETENGSTRLVDIASINNAAEYTHSYVLPSDLDGDERYITVKYMGDDQHTQQIGKGSLTIQKTNIVIDDLSNIPNEIQYQHNLSFTLDTGLTTIHDFYIKMNDKLIDIVPSKENGMLVFNKKLPSDIDVGSYQLHIESPATAVFNAYSQSQSINVTPADPIFDDFESQWTKYIGSEVTLPHQMKDYDGVNIDGDFTYIIRDGETLTPVNNKVILFATNDIFIDIHWESNNNNFISSDYTIDVTMEKNQIIVEIESDDTVYRGETNIPLIVTLRSLTTTDVHYPPYKVYIEDQEVTYNGSTFDMPLNLPDQNQYMLHIKYQPTEQIYSYIFNEFDEQFILKNKNVDEITVTNGNRDATHVNTLTDALSLIDNYGTIYIDKDITDEQCVNTKQVNILGDDRTFVNCSIQNEGILYISDVTFGRTQSNDKYSAIVNNNTLYVQSCTFKNQNAQYGAAIYIDSKNKNTEITNCTFNANEASLYGGAIFSNKGNDVKIQSCTFGRLNYANRHGSSISINGNMYLKDNIFYGNTGQEDIFIIAGSLEAENNFFEANINTINNTSDTPVVANLNYWGYNELTQAENTWLGKVNIDNWLISDYEIHWTEPALGQFQKHIIGRVNKYRTKVKEDAEEITLYNNVDGKMKLGDEYFNLNTEQITNESTLIIGQQTFDLEVQIP